MGRFLHCIVAALLALVVPAAALADANLQKLLAALTQGEPTTLITPLAGGVSEVTTVTPSRKVPPVEAAAALERARQDLAALGVKSPSGAQLAAALFGGAVDIPAGRTHLAGVLGQAAPAGAVRSQVVAAGLAPQAQPSAAAGAGATAGMLSHVEVAQALHLAMQQLSLHGIANPTAEQIRIAMFGGTLVPPSGPTVQLPGVIAGALR